MNNDIPNELQLVHTLQGHTSNIHQISWSPVNSILASPSMDKTTQLWQDGKRLEMLRDSAGRFIASAWSPDGNKLALSSDNDMLRLWDLEKGKSDRTRSGGLGLITCIGWTLDGVHIVTGAMNGNLRIWDNEFKNFTTLIKKSNDKIYCLALSNFSSLLAIGFESGKIQIWNMDSHKEVTILDVHKGPVYSLAYNAIDGTLLSSGADQSIRLFQNENYKATVLQGHTKAVTSLSFSFDHKLFASKSLDNTVRIWSYEILETLAILPENSGAHWLAGLAFHPTQPLLATLSNNDKSIRIWEIDVAQITGEPESL